MTSMGHVHLPKLTDLPELWIYWNLSDSLEIPSDSLRSSPTKVGNLKINFLRILTHVVERNGTSHLWRVPSWDGTQKLDDFFFVFSIRPSTRCYILQKRKTSKKKHDFGRSEVRQVLQSLSGHGTLYRIMNYGRIISVYYLSCERTVEVRQRFYVPLLQGFNFPVRSRDFHQFPFLHLWSSPHSLRPCIEEIQESPKKKSLVVQGRHVTQQVWKAIPPVPVLDGGGVHRCGGSNRWDPPSSRTFPCVLRIPPTFECVLRVPSTFVEHLRVS